MNSKLSIPTDEVHLWVFCVPEPSESAEPRRGVLSPDEIQRSARYRNENARLLFESARIELRHLLERYTGVAAAEVKLNVAADEKPSLASECAFDCQFNVSHSKERIAIAIGNGRAVGVDIECLDRVESTSMLSMARQFYTAREVAYLERLTQEQLRTAFFRMWTTKEAVLKASGRGMSGLRDIEDLLDAGDAWQTTVTMHSSNSVPGGRWKTESVDLRDRYLATVAAIDTDWQLKCYVTGAKPVLPASAERCSNSQGKAT